MLVILKSFNDFFTIWKTSSDMAFHAFPQVTKSYPIYYALHGAPAGRNIFDLPILQFSSVSSLKQPHSARKERRTGMELVRQRQAPLSKGSPLSALLQALLTANHGRGISLTVLRHPSLNIEPQLRFYHKNGGEKFCLELEWNMGDLSVH